MRRQLNLAVLGLVLGGCPGESSGDEREIDESLDPLSMPAKPTLSPSSFNSSTICAGCHPNHYAQWQLSRHSRSMRDPVYRALVAIRQHELDGAEDPFCTQCHSTICTRGGECGPGFSFDGLSAISLEGVTCEACHKVSEIMRPFNAGHQLDATGPIRGPIVDPVESGFHDSIYSSDFDQAEFCAACHDVVEISGLVLEQPYQEWLGSPANPDQPCQGCHMPTYSGSAATFGPERENLHSHRFVGVDRPLEGDVDELTMAELDAEIDALLGEAAALELRLPDAVAAGGLLEIVIEIENRIRGHAFPTGSTFMRQVWVELTVTDGGGRALYESGTLDELGDLRDLWSTVAPSSDPDLIALHSELRNHHGLPELFSWRATSHETNAIEPMQSRSFVRRVRIPEDAEGPLEVTAILHFRSHPPFLLRRLGLEELVEHAVVRDIDSKTGAVELAD